MTDARAEGGIGRPAATRARAGPALLLLLAVLLAAWALVVWQTGGIVLDLPWGVVSSRHPLRPLVASAVALLLLIGWTGRQGLAPAARAAEALLQPAAGAIAALAAAVAGLLAWLYGTHVAGGADPYGYVSQADLWSRGVLAIDFSHLAPLPWRNPEWTLSPLGYRPGPEPYTIVPTYAPGLPLLMAAARALAGAGAQYAVVPLCAAAAVWLTYVLGARLYDRFAGVLAAIALAASPTFLYQSMWPMSDVPAAAFWTLALVCALARHGSAPLGAGLAAGLAILIRPNLAPLALVPALVLIGRAPSDGGARWRRLAALAAGVLPASLLVAALHTYWYGSPVRTGYGTADTLYGLAHVWPNVQRYGRWLVETQGWAVVLALLPLVRPPLGCRDAALRQPLLRGAAALFLAMVAAAYVFYLVFEEWWYLRFLLPAFPLLFVLMAAAVLEVLRSRVHPAAVPLALLAAAAYAAGTAQLASSRVVFHLHDQERGYVEIARAVADRVPEHGVVLAMQHSGSLRHYAGRLTLRYDLVPPDALDLVVETLAARGRPVYLVLEDWEVPSFAGRFRGRSCRADPERAFARLGSGIRTARFYDLRASGCDAAAKRPKETDG